MATREEIEAAEVTVERAEQVLRAAYWSDVKDTAEDVLKQAQEEFSTANGFDLDSAREWTEDRLWESVDGSSRVIYTREAMDTLRWSENDGYTLEEWGADGVVTDGCIDWSKLAFGAFYADVGEHLWPLFGEWAETMEAGDEEEES